MRTRLAATVGTAALVASLAAVPAATAAAPTGLIISEYVEGSSLNKAVELFNGTDADVDLTDHVLEVYFNGSEEAGTTIDMAGTVAPGEVFVVADDGADAAILDQADHTTTSSLWNGDDVIVLREAGAVVDSFGQLGTDPGQQWGSGDTGAQDATLRRAATVCAGDTNLDDAFDPANEWVGMPSNTFDGLGTHSVDCDGGGDDGDDDAVVVASDLDGEPVGLLDHQNTAPAFSSPGDGFGIFQRGVSDSIPFSLLDDSAGSYAPDDLGIIGASHTGRFFGATDTENQDNTGPVTATWTFDIAGAEAPLFLNFDAGAMGDFESSDTFVFATAFDGAVPTEVMATTVDEDASREYTLEGGSTFTLDDPVDLAGTPLDDDLTTLSVALEGAGDTLTVAFTARTNGGDEAFAFDSLVITQGAPLADDGGGDPPPPPPTCDATDITLISQVQGGGSASPLAGDAVKVRAVVTNITPQLDAPGFLVQEEASDMDDDPMTSEGIHVAASIPDDLAIGDTVEVTGGVSEAYGRTQLNAGEVAVCDDVSPIAIEPTPLVLPATPGEREAVEGMLLQTTEDLYVTGLYSAWEYGELGVAPDGPLIQPTSEYAPDDPRAQELLEVQADSLLLINDRDEWSNDSTEPWFHEVRRRAGDVIPVGTTGTMNYSFGDYKLEPVELPEIVQDEERPDAPSLEGGNDLGAFNVLNYFNTLDLRGARSEAQFELQSAKIVEAITALDPTVLGIVEVENDYEDHYDGNDTTVPSMQTLVERLNAVAGDGTYDWVVPDEDDLVEEGLGTDEIAVGIIYQPDRATEVGDPATFDIDAQLEGEDTDKNRWPLAQSFEIDGEVVTMVVNHLKSKGSSCADVDGPTFDPGDDVETDLTGNCNLTRTYGAQRLVEWVETKPTGVNSPDTFVVGDLNSYEEEAPIEVFIDAGYEDAVQTFGGDAFTYKYNGRFGRLDYVLASPSAKRLLEDAAVWQANSPEPYGYLYYTDPVDTVETATAYASSDHDPVVVSIDSPGRSDARGRR